MYMVGQKPELGYKIKAQSSMGNLRPGDYTRSGRNPGSLNKAASRKSHLNNIKYQTLIHTFRVNMRYSYLASPTYKTVISLHDAQKMTLYKMSLEKLRKK